MKFHPQSSGIKISLNYPLKIHKPYTSWMDGIWKPSNA
jgi:hypothetical protein